MNRVFTADVLRDDIGAIYRELTKAPKLLVADVPWDDAGIKRAYKAADIPWPPPWADVQRAVWKIARDFGITGYCMTSVKSEGQCVSLAQFEGGVHQGTEPMFYSKDGQCRVVKATWAQGEPEISEKFRGQRDRLMAELAMVDALERGVLSEGDVVIDPVCGPAGGTAKAALKLGLGFVGIEVNASSAEVVRGLL